MVGVSKVLVGLGLIAGGAAASAIALKLTADESPATGKPDRKRTGTPEARPTIDAGMPVNPAAEWKYDRFCSIREDLSDSPPYRNVSVSAILRGTQTRTNCREAKALNVECNVGDVEKLKFHLSLGCRSIQVGGRWTPWNCSETWLNLFDMEAREISTITVLALSSPSTKFSVKAFDIAGGTLGVGPGYLGADIVVSGMTPDAKGTSATNGSLDVVGVGNSFVGRKVDLHGECVDD